MQKQILSQNIDEGKISSFNIIYNKDQIFIKDNDNNSWRDRTDDIHSCIENNGKYDIIFNNKPDMPYHYSVNNIKIIPPFFDKNIKQSHLYIGVKAGKKISDKIDKAKKSIKILSPFLGKKQIEQLNKKQKQNIDIKVITTYNDNDFKDYEKLSLLRNTIEQIPHTFEKKKIIFDFLKSFFNIYYKFYLVIFVLLLLFQITGISSILFQYKYIIALLFFVIPIIYKCYKSIKVFYYEYKPVIPIIFIKDSYNKMLRKYEGIYFHSKIFIIDDEIAFLGSINFTSSAFFYNFETCLTIDDKETIINLSESFDELYQLDLPKVNIYELGKKMYSEPIN